MICDICQKRTAVIFLEKNSLGSKKRFNLCYECAMERGISSDPKNIEASIANLFEKLTSSDDNKKRDEDSLCPVCGMSLGKIKIYGEAGCPECYSVFKEQIKETLARKKISGTYTGKLPNRIGSFRSVLTDRIMLENKLKAALEIEDYEKAAVYRDYLKALEKKSIGSGENS